MLDTNKASVPPSLWSQAIRLLKYFQFYLQLLRVVHGLYNNIVCA